MFDTEWSNGGEKILILYKIVKKKKKITTFKLSIGNFAVFFQRKRFKLYKYGLKQYFFYLFEGYNNSLKIHVKG